MYPRRGKQSACVRVGPLEGLVEYGLDVCVCECVCFGDGGQWVGLCGGQSGDPKAAAASLQEAKGPLNLSLYPAAAIRGCCV